MIAAIYPRAWVAVALVTVGCSVQEEKEEIVVLQCDYGMQSYGKRLQDVYSLDENTGSVQLMTVNPPRPGLLVVSDSVYNLEFPEDNPTVGYLLLKVNINRFTSKAEREIGRERTVTLPGGEVLNLHAVQDSGECIRMKGVAF